MMLLRVIVLVLACWSLTACVATGDQVGDLSSTDAYVKQQLARHGL